MRTMTVEDQKRMVVYAAKKIAAYEDALEFIVLLIKSHKDSRSPIRLKLGYAEVYQEIADVRTKIAQLKP